MDDSLIARARQGQQDAFNALINAHREALFRYAYLIVRDAAVAEDVTQDAVLQIYRALHRFDEKRAFRPWALRITRNVARNHNRSWGRYKHAVERFIHGRPGQTPARSVEALTQRQQHAQDLHDAVSQLPNSFQDVIYGRYFMELSVEDCAILLNVAPGTVKSRVHRALKQLRGLIERDYPHLVEEFDYV